MQSLPKGLLTTSPRISSHLKDSNIVDKADIALLWKVYHINPAIHTNDAGHRLENFFWRVWGNERLLGSLQGETVARLFGRIESSAALKMPSRSKDEDALAIQTSIPLSTTTTQMPPTPTSPEDVSRNTPPPPLPAPILKKPSAKASANATNGNGNDPSHKEARLLLTGLSGLHICRPSNPLTPISPPPFAVPSTASGGGGASNNGDDIPAATPTATSTRRRPYFVASKAGKRRPVLPRRKSSHIAVPLVLRPETRVHPEDGRWTNHSQKGEMHARKRCLSGQDQWIHTDGEQVPDAGVHITPDVEIQSTVRERVESPNPRAEDGLHPNDFFNLKHLLDHTNTDAANTKPSIPRPKNDPNPPANFHAPSNHIHHPTDRLKRLKPKSKSHVNTHMPPTTSFHTSTNPNPSMSMNMRPPRQRPPAPHTQSRLVDNNFRTRFVKEIQREEMLLKAINSLPDGERTRVLERHVVPDDNAVNLNAEIVSSNNNNLPATDTTNNNNPTKLSHGDNEDEWTTPDDADVQNHISISTPEIDISAIPLKFEGLSYTSSSRAASRLRAPGQLTVLFRAEQGGVRAGVGG